MGARLFASIVAASLLLAGQAQAALRLVYRVDDASVVLQGRHLVITARGAVRTGGWDRPLVRFRKIAAAEARTIEIEFLARPPSPRETVVQALLPISVRKVVPLPHYGAKEIEIVAESNALIVPIMGCPRAPRSRLPPPCR
ncbi:MAG: hypothetical protein JO261_00860 [Alphaproteobacteria bacterium]|nr:hypothetical protein [Alphaproteobacteria bacterium]MBV9692225.1 hypothetical protein [Alphaproteobacteria bacterium]